MRSTHLALILIGLTRAATGAQSDPPRPNYMPILRTERVGAGVVRIMYDLIGAPSTVVTVTLEASIDGGQTCAVRPRATTGDVGPNVTPGAGKAIEWDSTKVTDDLQLDRFVFRVVVSPAVVPNAGALKIVILQGANAVNDLREKTAVAPIVEVRDRNDLPLAGAIVTFAIAGGRNAAFANGAPTVTVTTSATGRAAATGVRTTGSGVVQIGVQAAFQGEMATATIQQTNVAQAAAASSSGSGAAGKTGGGLSRGKLAGLGGAAAGGIGIAVARGGGGNGGNGTSSSTPTIVTAAVIVVSPPSGTGIRAVTNYSFAGSAPNVTSGTFEWDFGDGVTGSGQTTAHVYGADGTFRVTLKITSGSQQLTGSATVVVGDLTGTWIHGIGADVGEVTLFLVQQGPMVAGQWRHRDGGGHFNTVPFHGTVSSPRIVQLFEDGECLDIANGAANEGLTQITAQTSRTSQLCNGVAGTPTPTGGSLNLIRQ